MSESAPTFFVRIFVAFGVFFRYIFSPAFAAGVTRLGRAEPPPAEEPPVAQLRETPADSALQLLSLLQQEGRFIDFIEEDVAGYSDAQVGAAVRVVHEGCRKALQEHFGIAPVREESEGARVTLEAGFDAATVRLTGNVVGNAPFTGTLVHRGWRSGEVKLPKLASGHDVTVLAPAEVEL